MDELQQVLNQSLWNITVDIMKVCLLAIGIMSVRFLIIAIPYWKSEYYKSTRKSFISLVLNTGAYGEYLTYRCLRKYEENGAKFLFNCYLPKDKDETSEIDVMMIFKSGIYVFESKNYSGWIFGSESSKTWTQSLPNGRSSRKERFYNPIMQNRTHIKWLEQQLDEEVPLHNIVVFSQRCELKKLEITSEDISVVKRDALPKLVREIDEKTASVLDEERISAIYDKLYPRTQVSGEVKEVHIENIERKYKDSSDITEVSEEVASNEKSEIDDMICPKCGSALVLRTTKKGENAGKQFYGCSAYPKCRYIKNL